MHRNLKNRETFVTITLLLYHTYRRRWAINACGCQATEGVLAQNVMTVNCLIMCDKKNQPLTFAVQLYCYCIKLCRPTKSQIRTCTQTKSNCTHSNQYCSGSHVLTLALTPNTGDCHWIALVSRYRTTARLSHSPCEVHKINVIKGMWYSTCQHSA